MDLIEQLCVRKMINFLKNIKFKKNGFPKYQTINPEIEINIPKGIFWFLLNFLKSKPINIIIPAELKLSQMVINIPWTPRKEPSKATNFSSPFPKTGLLNIFSPNILSAKKIK